LDDPEDLARSASIAASSEYTLAEAGPSGATAPLDVSRAMLLPVPAGPAPAVTFLADASEPTTLVAEVRASEKAGNFTPERVLHRQESALAAGEAQAVTLRPAFTLDAPAYLFYTLIGNPAVRVHLTDARVTGILSLTQTMNQAVAKGLRQEPPEGSGIDSFEFWLPARRPGGQNLALTCTPPLAVFAAANVVNGFDRPTVQANAWVAAAGDAMPRLTLRWPEPQTIARVELSFDTDFDHPLESVLWDHPERDIPFCVRGYRILGQDGALLAECADNRQTRNSVAFAAPVKTSELCVEIAATHGAPAAVFAVRCYST
jgi:hypothetical protein